MYVPVLWMLMQQIREVYNRSEALELAYYVLILAWQHFKCTFPPTDLFGLEICTLCTEMWWALLAAERHLADHSQTRE